MLFHSFAFIFALLPIAVTTYRWLSRTAGPHRAPAVAAVLVWSLVFYGWGEAAHLWLLLVSIAVNFGCGKALERTGSRWLLAAGVVFNLSLLGAFKYAGFFAEAVNGITALAVQPPPLALPLAISFFTFQQIAYLCDARAGNESGGSLLEYAAFVSFFPQLIAGPIVHHKDLIPQLRDGPDRRRFGEDVAVGTTLFAIGLFKKAVIADGIAVHADEVFSQAANGATLTAAQAWTGAIAYHFQIYFDFSAYSDMASGAARLFGIILPLNFNAPYRSTSIIEFWRRWHITLSHFLRDYLYIPLGGSRRGPPRWFASLMITMLLGGLWHGAGWNFLVWGGLHGGYLVINHLWRHLTPDFRRRGHEGFACRALAWLVTSVAVIVAWVFFRAEDLTTAAAMLEAMSTAEGLTGGWDALWAGLSASSLSASLAALWAGILLLPTGQQLLRDYRPALGMAAVRPHPIRWRPTAGWAFAVAILFLTAVTVTNSSEAFVYFRF